ncbi:hypothetical protein niasHT_029322 [Heterodera trifolii]|uniref:BTB domain-containing protein n=1 Tax=Heterodera trifolii TaxID=157864 RepID=A0ABD2KDH1_9BILA
MPSLGNSMERMKHLLSTAEHSDVLPAHQLILMNTSDVFEAMFRLNAKKKRTENASANCPVVKVPDVEVAAFKVMLAFIYTDELSELNGDNAMAVLYAAKKYNIPGLIRPCLDVPISELRNVFLAYAQALIFDLEKILCNVLDSDRLLLSDEFEIWKAAKRWADEKCRQYGIECSSKNRRSVLGPALFKIRFPNIHEEDFAKCVVSSGVLTEKEVLGVYQFNSHPNLYLRGVPGLYSLKFPSHGRIFDWNKAKKGNSRRGTLALEIEKMSEFVGESVGSSRFSDAMYINGLAWKIEAEITEKTEDTNEKNLGFYLWCDAKEGETWNCLCSATYRIILMAEKNEAENSTGNLCDQIFINKSKNWGFNNFINIEELMDPSNGFYSREEDKVTLAIDFTVKNEKMDKFILDQSKSNGTISLDIEKVSEFAREVIWSERKSEIVHIKGFPWKIMAEIGKINGRSTDNDEKWLGIYLWCDAPKEDKNWSCKCSATIRIMSQKCGVSDFRRKFDDHVFDNEENSWGYSNFTSFAELTNPRKGFYNKSEDKVTLAIDVTVKNEKTEDKS